MDGAWVMYNYLGSDNCWFRIMGTWKSLYFASIFVCSNLKKNLWIIYSYLKRKPSALFKKESPQYNIKMVSQITAPGPEQFQIWASDCVVHQSLLFLGLFSSFPFIFTLSPPPCLLSASQPVDHHFLQLVSPLLSCVFHLPTRFSY